MRRGDIVTVAGGVHASKPRPALVVQDNRFDATDSVTVCPFTTTTEVDAPLLRVPVAADEANGLGQDSYLMIDKTTVRRSSARTVLGRLEATPLVEFERRLLGFLGFGS